ncbi:hypothetical protein GSI_11188 [Ganoderma sinense ZZ0214-1]|uniref:non-specific serine/threonine protein kinase n=1 Tax=Ganoderma sinense ZZ0214-1 TaxID=1077348 RepID=A0A2G8RYV8_9APHY|nr:hypothetical protein GSI_11188 [Ganoderma sinense ZZ0214-1]
MFGVRHLSRRLRAGLVASKPRPPSLPRRLSTASFKTLDPSQRVEEEALSWYNPQAFYPVRIGEVLQSRYQVIGKLGYGAYSTVWLCRDLVQHRYVTIKVCTRNAIPVKRELAALQHLDSLPKTRHIGRTLVRTLLDQFVLTSEPAASTDSQSPGTDPDPTPPQLFQCLVHKPLLMSLFTFRNGNKLPEDFLKLVLQHVLLALDYLHSEAKLIHTDINENNILLDLDDIITALEAFEEAERTSPVARKDAGDRTIYLSRKIVTASANYGRPVLCDFGEARFGSATYTDPIQPFQYRAPEVILGAPWDEKVDIWTVGVMIWDMFEDRNMFKVTGGPDKKVDDLYHLAHMVALLGPPPVDLLQRGTMDDIGRYFDAQGKGFLYRSFRVLPHRLVWVCVSGNWVGATSLPDDSLEQSERNLEGEDKALFLAFVRKMVRWKPEERCSANELLDDPWLNKFEAS